MKIDLIILSNHVYLLFVDMAENKEAVLEKEEESWPCFKFAVFKRGDFSNFDLAILSINSEGYAVETENAIDRDNSLIITCTAFGKPTLKFQVDIYDKRGEDKYGDLYDIVELEAKAFGGTFLHTNDYENYGDNPRLEVWPEPFDVAKDLERRKKLSLAAMQEAEAAFKTAEIGLAALYGFLEVTQKILLDAVTPEVAEKIGNEAVSAKISSLLQERKERSDGIIKQKALVATLKEKMEQAQKEHNKLVTISA